MSLRLKVSLGSLLEVTKSFGEMMLQVWNILFFFCNRVLLTRTNRLNVFTIFRYGSEFDVVGCCSVLFFLLAILECCFFFGLKGARLGCDFFDFLVKFSISVFFFGVKLYVCNISYGRKLVMFIGERSRIWPKISGDNGVQRWWRELCIV